MIILGAEHLRVQALLADIDPGRLLGVIGIARLLQTQIRLTRTEME